MAAHAAGRGQEHALWLGRRAELTVRIGLVARCLNTAHVRGMGRYVYELLQQSRTEVGLNWRVYGDNPDQPMPVPDGAALERDIFSFRGDRFQLWEQVGLPRRVQRYPVDILHCTEGSLPLWQPVPTVVTLHDTLAWQDREVSRFGDFYLDTLLPAALSRCAAVITDSQSSRRDIVAKWPVLEAKVKVIPLGIAEEYLEDAADPEPGDLQRALGAAPYAVYLGGSLPRKRFSWAVEVLMASGQPDLQLVVCGFGAAARETASKQIPFEAQSRVHFAPFLSDEQLRAMYRGALAVLYPTLYEGFGFPAIEAQAAGVPAIFSPVSSLAELVGPLSFTVESHDLAAWVAALNRARALGERRHDLASKAKVWARQFSWEHTFRSHMAVYRQALGITG